MSADPERSMGQDDQDQILAWEMAALPPSEEPDWYADDALGTGPPWEIPGPGDPAWETLDPGDPGDEGPSAGAPFAEGGWADALAPDPVLATLVDLVQRDGLGRLDDDQLTGVLQAANRLAAWSASVRVAAVSGLAARRESAARESGDWRPFDHVDDEVAVALTLTRRSAGRLLDLALGLDRLPLTRAALAAGAIDERRAEVIAEEVAGLDDEHAAAVEKLIIGRAPGLTSGQLRALVRRAVLSADPKAARRRKEKALKDARVELFPETSGTAALAGRDLPPAAVLAADKHLTALAQAMKAAGHHRHPGHPARPRLPAPAVRPARLHPHPRAHAAAPGSDRPADRPQATPQAPAPAACPAASGPGTPGTPPAPPPLAGLRGSVNLTMPLSAWLGWTQSPGDVPGYGPVDAEDSRTLASQLAASPASRWCVTLTGARRAPRRPRLRPPRPRPIQCPATTPAPASPDPGLPGAPSPGHAARPTTGPRPRSQPPTASVPGWLRGLTFTTLPTTDCTHPRESRGYQPSPSLRHLIQHPQPRLHRPRLPPPRHPLRPRPRHPLRPRRENLRMQPPPRQQVITTHLRQRLSARTWRFHS